MIYRCSRLAGRERIETSELLAPVVNSIWVAPGSRAGRGLKLVSRRIGIVTEQQLLPARGPGED